MPKKALVLRYISPAIDQGAVLVKKGDKYILRQYKEADYIKTKMGEDTFNTPNYYMADIVENNARYFHLMK